MLQSTTARNNQDKHVGEFCSQFHIESISLFHFHVLSCYQQQLGLTFTSRSCSTPLCVVLTFACTISSDRVAFSTHVGGNRALQKTIHSNLTILNAKSSTYCD